MTFVAYKVCRSINRLHFIIIHHEAECNLHLMTSKLVLVNRGGGGVGGEQNRKQVYNISYYIVQKCDVLFTCHREFTNIFPCIEILRINTGHASPKFLKRYLKGLFHFIFDPLGHRTN